MTPALTELPSQLAPLLALGQNLLLITCRLLPLVVLTPVFGGQTLPVRLRLTLAGAMSLGLLAAAGEPVGLLAAGRLGLLVGKELLLGAVLAIGVRVVFETLAAFGRLADLARGQSMLTIYDPHFPQQRTTLSLAMQTAGVAAFLSFGGAAVLLDALARSLAIWPLHGTLPPALEQTCLQAAIELGGGLLRTSLQLAAPLLIAALLIDLTVALVQRVASPADVSHVSFAIKGVVLLALLIACWPWVAAGLRRTLAIAARLVPAWVGG